MPDLAAVGGITIDPREIDWHGPRGLHYRAKVRKDGSLIFKARLRSLKDLVVWASGKSNYLISKALNLIWNAAAFTYPTTYYFRLWTTTLTAASTGSTGTEAAYTGYAAVAVVANTTNFPTSSAGAAIQNATAITWPANTATVNTITYIGICDAATVGNMIYWGSITSTTVNVGDTPQINSNALTASEA